ncbi:hypothetical protein MRX96_004928 [Rhipicephalus microplus]
MLTRVTHIILWSRVVCMGSASMVRGIKAARVHGVCIAGPWCEHSPLRKCIQRSEFLGGGVWLLDPYTNNGLGQEQELQDGSSFREDLWLEGDPTGHQLTDIPTPGRDRGHQKVSRKTTRAVSSSCILMLIHMAASTSASLFDLYHHVWSFRDPRIEGWGVVTEGRLIFPLLFAYVYLAKIGGPRWMKNREPYRLRYAILTYNIATALVNAYFCYRYARATYFGGGYSFFCQGINRDGHSAEEVELNWWYLYVRIADFLDTFFFVARKKFSQISVLHVLHHFLVVLSGWVWLNFGNEGQGMLGLIINQAVHVIMYIYYFLAALGPSVRQYLWWKKYLTSLQIVQFLIVIVHISIPIFYNCGYPKPLAVLGAAQLLLGLVLFMNFYLQTYIRIKVVDKKTSQADGKMKLG